MFLINQNNEKLIKICNKLNHQPTFLETAAERAFLAALGGGCKTPIAAYATTKDSILHISGLVSSGDGRKQVKIDAKGLDLILLTLQLFYERNQYPYT